MLRWGYVIGALLLIASHAKAFDIDGGISGSWYNRAQDGHGFSIEVLNDTDILVYWYFYTPFGDSAFALGIGSYSGNTATVDLIYPHGMSFGAFAPEPTFFDWGRVTIRFSSCNRGSVEYNGILVFEDGTSFGSGSFPIERLASIQGLGCPAGSGGVVEGVNGLYEGFIDSPFAGQQTVYGLITDDNRAWFVQEPGGIYFGQVNDDGGNVTGSLTAVAEIGFQFADGSTSGTVFIDGTYVSGDHLNISYSGIGESGTVTLRYDNRYQRDARLARTAGNWSYSEPGYSVSMSVSNANFSGNTSTGCNFSGQMEAIDPDKNAYSVDASLSNCSPCNGSYEGVATVLDGFQFGDDRSLIVGIENGNCALVQQFFK